MLKILSEQIASELIKKISNNEYPPLSQLPNEKALMAEFDVSRGAIREAIKLLESRHVVQVRRGIGTFVTEAPGLTNDPFGLFFLPDRKRAIDLLEMRVVVEPSMVPFTCERITEKEICEMDESIDTMNRLYCEGAYADQVFVESDEVIRAIADCEIKFHSTLYVATHNSVLERMVPLVEESFRASYSIILANETYSEFRLDHAKHKQHAGILQAIKDKDVEEARRLSYDHVNAMLKFIRSGGNP